jgi:hypothetical protein
MDIERGTTIRMMAKAVVAAGLFMAGFVGGAPAVQADDAAGRDDRKAEQPVKVEAGQRSEVTIALP